MKGKTKKVSKKEVQSFKWVYQRPSVGPKYHANTATRSMSNATATHFLGNPNICPSNSSMFIS
jgi:hypothetical protein